VIALERLAMLALGDLPDHEAAEVEEHVLGCGECAARLERLADLGDAVRELVHAGRVLLPATAKLVSHLAREGLVTRTYRVAPGGAVACTVAAEDVYVALYLSVDTTDVDRIDFVYESPIARFRMDDVPFDREGGMVTVAQTAEYLRTLPTGSGTVRLVAVDSRGERALGEYVLNHTAQARSH
jgi:hypothetical protein